MTIRDPNRRPTHPGEVLREIVIPATGKSIAEVAEALGISRQMLSAILHERSDVSAPLAVKLGRYFGNGADVWMGMQTAVDLFDAAQRPEVKEVQPMLEVA